MAPRDPPGWRARAVCRGRRRSLGSRIGEARASGPRPADPVGRRLGAGVVKFSDPRSDGGPREPRGLGDGRDAAPTEGLGFSGRPAAADALVHQGGEGLILLSQYRYSFLGNHIRSCRAISVPIWSANFACGCRFRPDRFPEYALGSARKGYQGSLARGPDWLEGAWGRAPTGPTSAIHREECAPRSSGPIEARRHGSIEEPLLSWQRIRERRPGPVSEDGHGQPVAPLLPAECIPRSCDSVIRRSGRRTRR